MCSMRLACQVWSRRLCGAECLKWLVCGNGMQPAGNLPSRPPACQFACLHVPACMSVTGRGRCSYHAPTALCAEVPDGTAGLDNTCCVDADCSSVDSVKLVCTSTTTGGTSKTCTCPSSEARFVPNHYAAAPPCHLHCILLLPCTTYSVGLHVCILPDGLHWWIPVLLQLTRSAAPPASL